MPPAAACHEVDADLLERLRHGDEPAFDRLVGELSPRLLRLARTLVPSQAVAEEVVQETWLGVLDGLDRFEHRCSVRTWVFGILVNRARTRGRRERRTVPYAALRSREPVEHAAPLRIAAGVGRADHWASPAARRSQSPAEALEDAEVTDLLRASIATLPRAQRLTILMRDVEGWPAVEVCSALELTPGNQRVLLHRARATVRIALASYLDA